MADISISYAREDRSRVELLAKALESLGWLVWWEQKVRSGKHFDRVIEKALKEARRVLVVWSAINSSASRSAVQIEKTAADLKF